MVISSQKYQFPPQIASALLPRRSSPENIAGCKSSTSSDFESTPPLHHAQHIRTARPCSRSSSQVCSSVELEAAARGCNLPGDFVIEDFHLYDDAVGDSVDALSFQFWDDKTGIATFCSRSATSEPVIIPGATPRWPCENPLVQFINDKEKSLSVVEKACPSS